MRLSYVEASISLSDPCFSNVVLSWHLFCTQLIVVISPVHLCQTLLAVNSLSAYAHPPNDLCSRRSSEKQQRREAVDHEKPPPVISDGVLRNSKQASFVHLRARSGGVVTVTLESNPALALGQILSSFASCKHDQRSRHLQPTVACYDSKLAPTISNPALGFPFRYHVLPLEHNFCIPTSSHSYFQHRHEYAHHAGEDQKQSWPSPSS